MFRALRRSSSGVPTVFAVSGLHMRVVTARSQVWVGTQTWLRAVTTRVCKPETANTVGTPDDERRNAWNMLSFLWTSGIINSVTKLHLVGYLYGVVLQCTDPWILNLKIQIFCFIFRTFIHNLCLKLLMFITSNELLCLVITMSNYLYYLCVTEWLVLNCSTLVLWRMLATAYTLY